MQTILTPKQMRALEASAFQLGVPSLLLMENAARASFAFIDKALDGVRGKDILFLIGKGNNGGDGLALARLCFLAGAQPRVLLVGQPATVDANLNLGYVKALGIPMANWNGHANDAMVQPTPTAVVDAIYGTGFHGSLPPELTSLAEIINGLPVPRFALDIPSGLDSENGKAEGTIFHATHTLALGHLKTGHCLARSRGRLGEIHVLDLGIPQSAYTALNFEFLNMALEPADLLRRLPARVPDAHKGTNGRVLMYAGSLGLAGAAGMAALACLRAGAGLVTIACEEAVIPIVQTLVPGATCMRIEDALRNRPKYDVFLAGCGLGKGERVFSNILALWDRDKPSVWDADALNLLAEDRMYLGDKAVLTPHPGEAARLLSCGISDITDDAISTAKRLQEIYGGTVVLKDTVSIIYDGRRTAFNMVGSPALAKGGSGDALAGIIAGLLAQSPQAPVFDSAATACLWLGMAGQEAAARLGVLSPLTLDVIGCMGGLTV